MSELKSHAMAQGQGSRNADIVEAIEDKIRQLVSHFQISVNIVMTESIVICFTLEADYSDSFKKVHRTLFVMDLELKLQEEQQRNALEQMISADRLSLLGEIRDLRSTLSLSRLEKQDDHSKLADQLNILQEQFGKRERELKRKG